MYMGYLVLFTIFIIIVTIFIVAWTAARGESLLNEWAQKNGYNVLSQEYQSWDRGPFFWTSSKGQIIYRIVVKDTNGETLSGWVRVGGFWRGLAENKVEVRWDEEKRKKKKNSE